MDFVFEQIRTGGDRNFGYLLGTRQGKTACAIDPSFTPERFHERAEAQGLAIRFILNTHGHGDHTNGNAALKKRTKAHVVAHENATTRPDVPVAACAPLDVGGITVMAYHVPGHTDDHLLFHVPEHRIAITGDLLFVGKIGGTDTEEAARAEYDSLKRLLEILPDDTTVWPGHDYGCRPSSTIALEKANNPFLLATDFAAFLRLKAEWPAFKARNGLL